MQSIHPNYCVYHITPLLCRCYNLQYYTVVGEKFTVGIFHAKKFHVKIFSSSWVKYSHLPYLFNGKNISCVKFSS